VHPVLLAICSVLLSVAAQFLLKAGMKANGAAGTLSALLQPFVLAGLAAYGLSALVWLSVLARWEVSKAYPLVGAGFALTVLLGFVMGEAVSVTRWVGVGLICAGVFVVSRS
jgi:uncharacterized membrane protein